MGENRERERERVMQDFKALKIMYVYVQLIKIINLIVYIYIYQNNIFHACLVFKSRDYSVPLYCSTDLFLVTLL